MNFDLESLSPDMLKIAGAFYLIKMLVRLFYANTIRQTLLRIAQENRFMKPNMAWLVVIPFFNLIWNFQIASRMSDSLTNEFFDRKIAEEQNPGKRIGQFFAWTSLLSAVPFPPFIIITLSMLSLMYFISYWVKINNFKNLLVEHDRFRQESQNES